MNTKLGDRILIGIDGQPIDPRGDTWLGGGMDWVKGLGADHLHRYDSGPQKNVTVAQWVAAARQRGLKYILQGTVCEAQGYDCWSYDPSLIAIAHDDEPDLNRWNAGATGAVLEWQKSQFYAPGERHPAMTGWTRYEILEDRYKRWSEKIAAAIPSADSRPPILLNMTAANAMGRWTVASQAFQRRYILSSDVQSVDYHPANNAKMTDFLGFHAILRIRAFGGRCLGVYFEMGDEALDSSLASTVGGRAPTNDEVGIQILGAVIYGVRWLWGFPQQIGRDKDSGRSFRYDSCPPALEAYVRDLVLRLREWERVIVGGVQTVTETPVYAMDAARGSLTLPMTVISTWVLGSERLVVTLDLAGAKVTWKYDSGAVATPAETRIVDLETRLAAATGALDSATAKMAGLAGRVAELTASEERMAVANERLTTGVRTIKATVDGLLI